MHILMNVMYSAFLDGWKHCLNISTVKFIIEFIISVNSNKIPSLNFPLLVEVMVCDIPVESIDLDSFRCCMLASP